MSPPPQRRGGTFGIEARYSDPQSMIAWKEQSACQGPPGARGTPRRRARESGAALGGPCIRELVFSRGALCPRNPACPETSLVVMTSDRPTTPLHEHGAAALPPLSIPLRVGPLADVDRDGLRGL